MVTVTLWVTCGNELLHTQCYKPSDLSIMTEKHCSRAASFLALIALRCSTTRRANRFLSSPLKLSSETLEHPKNYCLQWISSVTRHITDRSCSLIKACRKDGCGHGKHFLSNLHVLAGSIVTTYFPRLSIEAATPQTGLRVWVIYAPCASSGACQCEDLFY